MTTVYPWQQTTVAEEFYVQLGKRLDAAVNRGELKTCINNRGVRWGRVRIDDAIAAPLTPADIRDLRLTNGDVLMCEGGEIGRSAIWNDEIPEAYFLNTLHRLRSKGSYNPRLLVAFFERWAGTGELSAVVGKATLAHLTKENLLRIPLPVPCREEQNRIVAALSVVESSIATLERLIAKKQAIKQGMMQQLLTGRTRLPGFTRPWTEVFLGDVARFGKGSGLPKSAINSFGSTPCIHYGELFTHYGPEILHVTSRTNPVGRVVFSEDLDVLMPTSDVTPRGLAKASAIHGSGVVLGGDLLIIRPEKEAVYGPFLAHIIRYDADRVLQLVRGSTVYHLYAADMRNFPGSSQSRV